MRARDMEIGADNEVDHVRLLIPSVTLHLYSLGRGTPDRIGYSLEKKGELSFLCHIIAVLLQTIDNKKIEVNGGTEMMRSEEQGGKIDEVPYAKRPSFANLLWETFNKRLLFSGQITFRE